MAIITLDLDGTIYSTPRRIIDLAKIHYPESYMGGTWEDIKYHGFSPVLDLSEDKIQDLFNRKDFYIKEYIMDGAIETIKKLQSEGHIVDVFSVGTLYNDFNKKLLLKGEGLAMNIMTVSTIGSNDVKFDKGTRHSNNKDKNVISVYVDDRIECLNTVRGYDFLIQMREKGYSQLADKKWCGHLVTNWKDLDDKIHKIIKYNE